MISKPKPSPNPNEKLLEKYMTSAEIAACYMMQVPHADFLANKEKLKKHFDQKN